MAKSILEAVAALGPNHGRKPKDAAKVAAAANTTKIVRRAKRARRILTEMIGDDPPKLKRQPYGCALASMLRKQAQHGRGDR